MKYFVLPILALILIGCGSQEVENATSTEAAPGVVSSVPSNSTFSIDGLQQATGLSTKLSSKRGKSVDINGGIIEVGTLGGSNSFIAESNNGVVVGGSHIQMAKEDIQGEAPSNIAVHAFIHADGKIKDLGTLGGNYSKSSSVNASGVVVGGSEKADKTYQAFKYENNTLIGLPQLSGGRHSWAHSINDSSLIAGEAKDSSGSLKAVLWQGNSVVDLNSLLPAGSGWVLSSAKTIDNNGLVTGVGRLNGTKTYFQLNVNITE